MTNTPAELVEANLARMRFPVESEPMAEFVAALEPINTLADRAAGFIWRHRSERGGHVSLADATGDPLLMINLSVWRDYQALHEFTYRSAHMRYVRRRGEWFTKIETPATVLWWIRSGEHPTPQDALARLQYLRRYGPTPRAFTVRTRFDSTGRRETRPRCNSVPARLR